MLEESIQRLAAAVEDNTKALREQIAALTAGTPKVAPKTPKADAPKAETPKAETPKAETPKAETPKAETPKAETPKAETPKAETPKAETPKPEPTTPTLQQIRSLGQEILDACGQDPKRVHVVNAKFGVKSLRDLPADKHAEAYKLLSEQLAEAKKEGK